MKITSEELQIVIVIVQLIGLPIIVWGMRWLSKILRGNKLNDIKIEALVNTLSRQFGNGEFRKSFDKNVIDKKKDYKFINHGK